MTRKVDEVRRIVVSMTAREVQAARKQRNLDALEEAMLHDPALEVEPLERDPSVWVRRAGVEVRFWPSTGSVRQRGKPTRYMDAPELLDTVLRSVPL